jgi:hypothetical protein
MPSDEFLGEVLPSVGFEVAKADFIDPTKITSCEQVDLGAHNGKQRFEDLITEDYKCIGLFIIQKSASSGAPWNTTLAIMAKIEG